MKLGLREHNGHRDVFFCLAANFLAGTCLRILCAVTFPPYLGPRGTVTEVSVAIYARDHLPMNSPLNSFERDGHHRFPIDARTLSYQPRKSIVANSSRDRQYSNTLCLLKNVSSFFRPPKYFQPMTLSDFVKAHSVVLESSYLRWDCRGRKTCRHKAKF